MPSTQEEQELAVQGLCNKSKIRQGTQEVQEKAGLCNDKCVRAEICYENEEQNEEQEKAGCAMINA
jgi:hypothetical protein